MAGLVALVHQRRGRRCRGVARYCCRPRLLACGGLFASAPAAAQELHIPAAARRRRKNPRSPSSAKRPGRSRCSCRRTRSTTTTSIIASAAVGNVQIYYGGSTLEADKVIYDQTTKRLHAEGNVRLTEEDGKITYGEIMDLSDDYRDGFVDSLRLDAPDQTRMAAARAERIERQLHRLPQRRLYRLRAVQGRSEEAAALAGEGRAHHPRSGREDDLFRGRAASNSSASRSPGCPTSPRPIRRSSARPACWCRRSRRARFTASAVEVPYYWALAPDYDATFAPMITTKQGPLLQGEFRQRLLNGAYSIRGAGIYQLDPEYFQRSDGTTTPGYRDWRGSLESDGQFALTDKWVWGWDGRCCLTDRPSCRTTTRVCRTTTSPIRSEPTSEAISQLYITGKGNRSYFDARSIYYLGFSERGRAEADPGHPSGDRLQLHLRPSDGRRRARLRLNFTSLTRNQAELRCDHAERAQYRHAARRPPTPRSRLRRIACCAAFPEPTAASRRRRIGGAASPIQFGQVFTPFASLRAERRSMQINNDPGVSNFINTGDTNLVRAMPTVGLEYRYPFISVQILGHADGRADRAGDRATERDAGRPLAERRRAKLDIRRQQSVPRRQVLRLGSRRRRRPRQLRPAVHRAVQPGRLRQRVVRPVLQLFGHNSFAWPTRTNTGLDSGLDTTRSDYVARVSYQPNSTYKFTSRFRFDNDTSPCSGSNLKPRASFDRWNVSLLYGDYAAQPEIGFLNRRQGILGTGMVKLDANWVLLGGARYDLNADKFDQTRIGLGYVDDCLILGLNYITNYTYSGNVSGQPYDHAAAEPAHARRHVGDTGGRPGDAKAEIGRLRKSRVDIGMPRISLRIGAYRRRLMARRCRVGPGRADSGARAGGGRRQRLADHRIRYSAAHEAGF